MLDIYVVTFAILGCMVIAVLAAEAGFTDKVIRNEATWLNKVKEQESKKKFSEEELISIIGGYCNVKNIMHYRWIAYSLITLLYVMGTMIYFCIIFIMEPFDRRDSYPLFYNFLKILTLIGGGVALMAIIAIGGVILFYAVKQKAKISDIADDVKEKIVCKFFVKKKKLISFIELCILTITLHSFVLVATYYITFAIGFIIPFLILFIFPAGIILGVTAEMYFYGYIIAVIINDEFEELYRYYRPKRHNKTGGENLESEAS